MTTVKERGEGEIVREGYPVYRMYGVSENPYGDRDVMEDAVAVIEKDLPEDRPWCQFVGMTGQMCIRDRRYTEGAGRSCGRMDIQAHGCLLYTS